MHSNDALGLAIKHLEKLLGPDDPQAYREARRDLQKLKDAHASHEILRSAAVQVFAGGLPFNHDGMGY
jgi:hypothetical protein